jgi:hypothetical protein
VETLLNQKSIKADVFCLVVRDLNNMHEVLNSIICTIVNKKKEKSKVQL